MSATQPRPTNGFILAHENSDIDCLTALWLLQRFGGFDDADVRFTNIGNPDPKLVAEARAVVDLGGVCNPDAGRFDHHQNAQLRCAACLVWDWTRACAMATEHLLPLLQQVDAVDRGGTGNRDDRTLIRFSINLGLHALLVGYRQSFRDAGLVAPTDWMCYQYVSGLLDALAANLKHQYQAERNAQKHIVYRSTDGKLVALKGAGKAESFAALRQGAQVVVFHSWSRQPNGETWHAIGVMREGGPDGQPHVGHLTETAIRYEPRSVNSQLLAELESWYNDNRGFFAGRSDKGDKHRPPLVDLVIIARALDAAWVRK